MGLCGAMRRFYRIAGTKPKGMTRQEKFACDARRAFRRRIAGGDVGSLGVGVGWIAHVARNGPN
jgi:hypothetical protein